MADLTITLTESVTLNGADQGSTNTKTVTGVNEILRQVRELDNDETTIFQLDATESDDEHTDGHQMVSTQLKYFRITNLSGSNTVRLAFYKVYTDGNDEAFIVKLEAGHSFVASTDDFSADDNFNSGSALISAATDVQWTTVRGIASADTTHIEVFAASS